jgi:hypothetical protein
MGKFRGKSEEKKGKDAFEIDIKVLDIYVVSPVDKPIRFE